MSDRLLPHCTDTLSQEKSGLSPGYTHCETKKADVHDPKPGFYAVLSPTFKYYKAYVGLCCDGMCSRPRLSE